MTVAPVEPSKWLGQMPVEFCRTGDLARVFGTRRGTAYNLHHDGKIKSVLLRCRGQKSGLRLWDVASVREFIRSQAVAA